MCLLESQGHTEVLREGTRELRVLDASPSTKRGFATILMSQSILDAFRLFPA